MLSKFWLISIFSQFLKAGFRKRRRNANFINFNKIKLLHSVINNFVNQIADIKKKKNAQKNEEIFCSNNNKNKSTFLKIHKWVKN